MNTDNNKANGNTKNPKGLGNRSKMAAKENRHRQQSGLLSFYYRRQKSIKEHFFLCAGKQVGVFGTDRRDAEQNGIDLGVFKEARANA